MKENGKFKWMEKEKGDNAYEEIRFKKGRKWQQQDEVATELIKVDFSKIRVTYKCFPSEPTQESTSLTFGIDMVLYIPDGVEVFL